MCKPFKYVKIDFIIYITYRRSSSKRSLCYD